MVLFPPPFYFSFISQTSYRTYKIISSYELARPIMGTIFLVIIIGERAKRARHSQVCSIENRGYIYYYVYIVRANFVLITRKGGGA